MRLPSAERRERETSWLSLVLAWVAGYVNAVAFLQLARTAASHMSGTTIKLGVDLGRGDLSTAAFWLTPIPLFLSGIIVGVAAIRLTKRSGWSAPYALILSAEVVLLGIYVGYATTHTRGNSIRVQIWWQITLLIALPAVAMGLQTAMVKKVAGRRLRTTYMTGMMSDFSEDVVDTAAWFLRRTRGRSWRRHCLALRVMPRRQTWVRLFLLPGIWICFVVGAVSGGYAESRIQAIAMAAPIVVLLVVTGVELVRPTENTERTPLHPS